MSAEQIDELPRGARGVADRVESPRRADRLPHAQLRCRGSPSSALGAPRRGGFLCVGRPRGEPTPFALPGAVASGLSLQQILAQDHGAVVKDVVGAVEECHRAAFFGARARTSRPEVSARRTGQRSPGFAAHTSPARARSSTVTRLPRARPISFQMMSLNNEAATPTATATGNLSKPAPARAPAASRTGSLGTGSASCSAATHANITA